MVILLMSYIEGVLSAIRVSTHCCPASMGALQPALASIVDVLSPIGTKGQRLMVFNGTTLHHTTVACCCQMPIGIAGGVVVVEGPHQVGGVERNIGITYNIMAGQFIYYAVLHCHTLHIDMSCRGCQRLGLGGEERRSRHLDQCIQTGCCSSSISHSGIGHEEIVVGILEAGNGGIGHR